MPAAQPHRKLSAAALRQLARGHTREAIEALADIVTRGNSEASRISAALALLDRGYGKSGAGLSPEGGAQPPVLYHWIELIDGTEDHTRPGHPVLDDPAGNGQAQDRKD